MATDWDGEERRTHRLHADDVTLIVNGVTAALSNHFCRFSDIKTNDMKDVIPFMMSFKKLTEKTGMFIWYLILGTVGAGILGLTALGIWRKQ